MPVLDMPEVKVPEVEQPKEKEPTVADVLYKAAELIDQGWCQGTEHTIAGSGGLFKLHDLFCAIGAIRVTALRMPVTVKKQNDLYMAARHTANEVADRLDGCSIMTYNDSITRRKEEVVAALRMAGDLAVQKGINVSSIRT